ncbi:MAG: hypothetical protein EBR49_00370 [Betaproteobacteria bacterium]|nr:hypothetical protein [Betaproteobacteria bacterium]
MPRPKLCASVHVSALTAWQAWRTPTTGFSIVEFAFAGAAQSPPKQASKNAHKYLIFIGFLGFFDAN